MGSLVHPLGLTDFTNDVGPRTIEHAALRSVSWHTSDQSHQLIQHPATIGIHAIDFVKSDQVFVKSRIIPPPHLRPFESVFGHEYPADPSQDIEPKESVLRVHEPIETCNLCCEFSFAVHLV